MNIKWANERWTKTWKQTFMNRYIKLKEAKTWFWVLRGCCQSREIKLTVTNWGDKNDICGRNIFSSLYRSWFQPLVGLNPPCLTLGGSVQKYSWVNVVYYPCNSTCLVITLWYESVFAVQTYNHTHMKPHRELLRCRSGRKTKEDRSERRYNQPWVLRKKHFTFFLPVFQLPPLISIFQSPPLVWSSCGGWWGWHKQIRFRVWIDKNPAAGVAAWDPQTLRWGSRRGSAPVVEFS